MVEKLASAVEFGFQVEKLAAAVEFGFQFGFQSCRPFDSQKQIGTLGTSSLCYLQWTSREPICSEL